MAPSTACPKPGTTASSDSEAGWSSHEVFDTSWDSQPASLSLDAVVPGFAEAVQGATVGSQLLVVIPPDLGYGDTAQGAIPAGSTLVFVIDVLGLDQAPTG